MSYLDICAAQLPIDEGTYSKPYKDSLGILTIGIGRNLERGLRPDEIQFLFKNDLALADLTARNVYMTFDKLSDNRKAVLVNLAFNMGQARLSGFTKTLAAIVAGDYDTAANEMLASKWAVQVGLRAVRLAKLMREG